MTSIKLLILYLSVYPSNDVYLSHVILLFNFGDDNTTTPTDLDWG